MADEVKEINPTIAGLAFTVASRPQRRMSNVQTVSNLNGPVSFSPIPLVATGFVRKVALYFEVVYTTSASAAVVAGDSPWNVINAVTLTDATGQPIYQPLSGYNLYLLNKYFSHGGPDAANRPLFLSNPHMGPEYTYSASGTSGTAKFRLDLDLEFDYNNGYGCVPNLDANASLQLKIDVAAFGTLFSGGTASVATVSVRVDQHYWAPVPDMLGGQPVNTEPAGLGDYLEKRYESQVVTASAETPVRVNNRGGLMMGLIGVSRNSGTRTAFTPNANVGLVLDNNPIDEGIRLEAHQDLVRRIYGYLGTDIGTSYAPLTAGTLPGLDNGVQVWNFDALSGGRDSWLSTRNGSQLELKVTPGAGATQFEVITIIGQIQKQNARTFYGSSAIA